MDRFERLIGNLEAWAFEKPYTALITAFAIFGVVIALILS